MSKIEKVDVLVVTPPRRALVNNIIAHNAAPLNQGIDSIPLRLAAVVEQNYKVGFYPFYFTQYNFYELDCKEIEKIVKLYDPEVIIIANDYFISNRTTACTGASVEIGKIFKNIKANGKVICTGKHSIVCGPDYLIDATGAFDVVIQSEAEPCINSVIDCIVNDNIENLNLISNISFMNNGSIIETPKEIIVCDINQLPVPAYHLLQPHLEELLEMEKPYGDKLSLTLRTSYGCVYSCPYCGGGDTWNNYRIRESSLIKDDIRYANSCLGENAEFVFLDDELFTYNAEHVKNIADVFEELDIVIHGVLTHVNYFNDEIAKQLKRFSTCVLFGGENFSNRVLTSLGKNQDKEKIVNACGIAHKNGLSSRVEYIVGLPEEDYESVIENINFIFNSLIKNEIGTISPYILVPHPGTKYYTNPERYGIKILNNDLDSYIEEGHYPVFETKHLNTHQIYTYYMLLKHMSMQAKMIRNSLKSEGKTLSHSNYSIDAFKHFFKKIEN